MYARCRTLLQLLFLVLRNSIHNEDDDDEPTITIINYQLHLYRAVHHRRRNMSGDLFAVNHLHQSAKQPHSNDVTTTLSQMSISDMNRYHRSRRRHLFPNHSQTDDCFSDDSSGENYKQHRHHDKECICEQSPLSADIKSVHILEPIKSAGTIFDPTETARKSIAKSFIAHNNVDRQQQLSAETSRSDDSPQHRTTTASEIPHGNLSQLQNWHDNNMQLARDVDVQSKPATIVATKSPIQPLISPERTVMQSSSDDGLLLDENHHSLTPLINDKHYGENDSSERRLVSPQRRNSHPTTISSNNSSMNESQSTEVWDFFDYESDSYWPDCSPYRDTVVRVFGPIDSPKNNGNIRKMMCTYVGGYGTSSSSSSAYTALYNHKNQQKQQSREYCNNLSADDDDNDDDDNDDNSEMDHPRYCKICDIWFGSLDPSYPFKCNCENPTKTETLNTLDTQSVYSVHMRKDFRYFFQHPYSRLFIAYLVVFCNFLIFAEDPISHSLRECKIPILGNVISFLFTKYPPEPDWQLFKGALAVVGIVFGLLFGKYVLHHIVLRRLFRLKMFRNESGSWMIMSISMVLSVFVFSMVYNIILRMFHPNAIAYLITQRMGISFASFMKIAACGTWLGDFFTAWMITDMMLQDNLYPDWAKWLRRFWHRHPNIRVFIFWGGALVIAATVITIILTDRICWDQFNHSFIITSELSRAILASFILFMDLLIVMQDWDFPHFVCDLNIKLPGMLQPSYTFNFCRKSLKFPEFEVKVSGKWFNYGIIVFVMMLDLNMWRNQVIYYPADFGQYVDPINHKVFTVNETDVIADPAFTMLHIDDADRSSNATVWTYETRKIMIDPATNRSAIYSDLVIESRYHGYAAMLKALTFIPGFLGLVCFFLLIFLYGRFPPKTDKSIGGRLKKRDRMHKSSWRRERRDSRGCHHSSWPAISNYCVDPNRFIRQHDNSDIDFSMSPNRPTYMMFSGAQIDLQTPLPTANKLQAETSININPEPKSTKPIEQNKEIIPQLRSPSVLPDIVIPFVPEHLNEHQSSRSPLSAQSSSTSSSPSPPNVSISSYLPRLLPQFNAPLLWSSIVSILNLSSNKTPAQPSSSPVTGPVTNICVQPLRTIPNEWLRLDHVLSHTSPVSFSVSASPSQQSSSCAEIKFGTIPSFQPSNKPIIPFQTQVVQLPIRAS